MKREEKKRIRSIDLSLMRAVTTYRSLYTPNAKAKDGCTLHGLRSTATKDLLESGNSNSEAMSITGHQTDSMLRRYARDVRQKGLAEQAMGRWEANGKAPAKG